MKRIKKYITTILLLVSLLILPDLAFAATTKIIYSGGSGFAEFGTPSYWHYQYTGTDGNPLGYSPPMQWTWNTSNVLDNYASWGVSQSGSDCVDLYAYIPRNYANLDNAQYELWYGNTHSDSAFINQSNYYDQWVYLKRYQFLLGYNVFVKLRDFTPGVPTHTRYIGFDEMKFVFL